MIGVNRGLRLRSANRVSTSTKIWWPSVVPTGVKTRSPRQCWHPRRPHRERFVPSTSRRQLLGINLYHDWRVHEP